MAVINFPDSPSDGATQTVGGITYTYSSSKGYWTAAASSGGGGGGGASVTTDDTAPSSPSDGDLWYDTDDGGMFVYYADTDSSQWVEVIGSQGATGAAGAAGADGGAGVASVYATVNDLPVSGNTQGDMAHVTANNTLYFWNGSGWYKIALINTNPSISGVASSYALADDGTATTVTITASDPEGLPITYSIASDTSGNIATVTQGTGASTNVFTITPSTNSAYAGSFTLTFRASDGVNIATAPATFTLQFLVQNSNYTTALITTAGNAGTNNTFTDSSSNSHTVTVNGNVTQNSFSPYRSGGYSVYLNTNTSYIRSPTSADFDIGGTGDWSYEAWVYVPSSHTFTTYPRAFGLGPYYNDPKTFGILLSDPDHSNYITVYWDDAAGQGRKLISSTAFNKGQWNHILIARSGNSIGLFYNGTRIASNDSYTSAIDSGNTYLFVGHTGNGTEGSVEYIKDLRFINGSHPYDASASSITVPTEQLSEVTNTKFLLGQKPYLADVSSSDHALTLNGTVTTEPFTPFDHKEYAVGDHGGSAYFDGSGDYLTPTTSTDMDFGTGDFTIECWINQSSYNSGDVIADGRSVGTDNGWSIETKNNGIQLYSSGGIVSISSGTNFSTHTNTWIHIAVVRNSGTITTYINGTNEGSVSYSTGIDTTGSVIHIGRRSDGVTSFDFNGYISDLRIVSSAVYTTDFTPPTAPLSAVTNTNLLLNMQGAKIFDKSQSVEPLTLAGDTTASTAQYKYLPTSMYFDGTGDYISMPRDTFTFGTDDFTIEFWIYHTSATGYQTPFELGYIDAGSILMQTANNSLAYVTYHGSSLQLQESGSFSTNTWYHIALVRNGGTMTLYRDGTASATGTYSNNYNYSGTKLSNIGAGHYNSAGSYPITGYMSDFRVTKGLARYTANFTPPTAALQG